MFWVVSYFNVSLSLATALNTWILMNFVTLLHWSSLITALFLLFTGVLPLYFWIGNPFCWSCYPLRFLIAAPAGLGFMVMVLTPSMGIAKYRVMTKVPELKSAVAGPSDIIFMIGLVFWVILIVGFLFWKIFSNFVLDLCPCLTWCMEDDDKKKNKEEEKTTGCLCFWGGCAFVFSL